jgi:hypothetical protein
MLNCVLEILLTMPFFSEMSAWSQPVLHVKLIVDQPDMYGIQRFISVFGLNRHLALSRTAEISQQADCVYVKLSSNVN